MHKLTQLILDHIAIFTVIFSIIFAAAIKLHLAKDELEPQCDHLDKLLGSKRYRCTEVEKARQKQYLKWRYYFNFKFDVIIAAFTLTINAAVDTDVLVMVLFVTLATILMIFASSKIEEYPRRQGWALFWTLVMDFASIILLAITANIMEG